MPALPFSKGHGLGNDYIVIDVANLPWPLSPARVRALCDRHRGVGGDGVLLVDTSADPVGLRIFNPDGGEAEKSGNGLRILAAYLHGRGLVGLEPFEVRLPGETVVMRVEGGADDGVLQIDVDMGRARFRGEDAGFLPEPGDAFGHELRLGDGDVAVVHPLSVGNPHCVVLVDELDQGDFLRRAPRLSTHPAFAAGANVQFLRVAGRREIELLIWERGAGETSASGSSACAATAAGVRLGLLDHEPVAVRMPGGTLEVTVSPEYDVRLRGPAQIVFEGQVRPEVVGLWGRG